MVDRPYQHSCRPAQAYASKTAWFSCCPGTVGAGGQPPADTGSPGAQEHLHHTDLHPRCQRGRETGDEGET